MIILRTDHTTLFNAEKCWHKRNSITSNCCGFVATSAATRRTDASERRVAERVVLIDNDKSDVVDVVKSPVHTGDYRFRR